MPTNEQLVSCICTMFDLIEGALASKKERQHLRSSWIDSNYRGYVLNLIKHPKAEPTKE